MTAPLPQTPEPGQRPHLMPMDTPDHMAPAWAGCMSWAVRDAEIRAAFERETGCSYVAPQSALDAMIDKATGAGDDYVRQFIEWANVNVWGQIDGEPAP